MSSQTFVDGGAAPHLIYPKPGARFVGPLPEEQSRERGPGGGVLTFMGSDGHWVSVHVVHHPATPVDGFFGRAYLNPRAVRADRRGPERPGERGALESANGRGGRAA
jgi:hypothetical protein